MSATACIYEDIVAVIANPDQEGPPCPYPAEYDLHTAHGFVEVCIHHAKLIEATIEEPGMWVVIDEDNRPAQRGEMWLTARASASTTKEAE